MNKEQLWALFLQHNPRLVADPHFTPESIRRFFDMVWNVAYESCTKDWIQRQKEMGIAPEEDEETDFIEGIIAATLDALGKVHAEEKKNKKQ
jgi:hypothetical protein